MPSMAGSFGRFSGPFDIATKRARIRSPRSVETIQREGSLVPAQFGDFGLEAGVGVEVEVAADGAAVLHDLRRPGIAFAGDVAEFFEQRQVDVGLDVALGAGVAVPVPGAAEVAALFDDADVGDARLAQARAGEQTAEAAADDDHIDVVGERRARQFAVHVGVFDEAVKSPTTSRYWSLPSARSRLSRSSRYFSRKASGSNPRSAGGDCVMAGSSQCLMTATLPKAWQVDKGLWVPVVGGRGASPRCVAASANAGCILSPESCGRGKAMTEIATTSYGQLQGMREGDILAFRGVPFAQPPVGALRFRAPVAPQPWTGVRDALRVGASAPQVTNEALDSVLPSGEEQQDEDCLYLNIWTPALDGGKRPVMVWIHGGAFTIGSGSSPMYAGRRLAERGDAVIVTINYRLGVLGFLCLDEAGDEPFTNFGMLDQVAALRWVRDEIGNFGGDPANVTIFGESAGGMSVGALMGSPLAAGLFRRAIPQSGAGHNALTVDTARETARRFAKLAGASAATREALAGLEPAAILEAQGQLDAETMAAMAEGRPPEMPFQPVVDGHFLQQLPIEAIRAGNSAGVSLLIGTTAEESRLFTAMMPPETPRDDESVARAFAARLTNPTTWRPAAMRCASIARHGKQGARPQARNDLYVAADTDFMFTIPAERLAEAQAAREAGTFMYRFDWKSPMLDGALGACHALELPFVFATQDLPGLAAFAGEGERADQLAADVSGAWLAFARSGDPSTPELPWPAYTPETRSTMVLDAPCRVEERPHEDERRCWDGRR